MSNRLGIILLIMILVVFASAVAIAAGEVPEHDHEWDTSTWVSDENSHWHGCTVYDECEAKVDEAPHTGGTHANGGICSVCGAKYQDHGNSYEVSSYTTTSTKHIANYKCKFEGCNEVYVGEEEDHYFSPWERVDNTKHGRTCYDCSYYEESNHTGGTHANDGICTTCNFQYQEHGINLESIVAYEKNAVGHAAKYACKYAGCTNVYIGESVLHEDTNSDGNCDACGYALPSSDIEPPVGIITLKNALITMNGNPGTKNSNVTLQISATDESTITQMALTNENSRSASDLHWIPFAEEIDWTISPGDGLKTIYLMLKDEHGNASLSFVE